MQACTQRYYHSAMRRRKDTGGNHRRVYGQKIVSCALHLGVEIPFFLTCFYMMCACECLCFAPWGRNFFITYQCMICVYWRVGICFLCACRLYKHVRLCVCVFVCVCLCFAPRGMFLMCVFVCMHVRCVCMCMNVHVLWEACFHAFLCPTIMCGFILVYLSKLCTFLHHFGSQLLNQFCVFFSVSIEIMHFYAFSTTPQSILCIFFLVYLLSNGSISSGCGRPSRRKTSRALHLTLRRRYEHI